MLSSVGRCHLIIILSSVDSKLLFDKMLYIDSKLFDNILFSTVDNNMLFDYAIFSR